MQDPKVWAGMIAEHIITTGEKWQIGYEENHPSYFLQEVALILKEFNIEFNKVTYTFDKLHIISNYYRSGVEL